MMGENKAVLRDEKRERWTKNEKNKEASHGGKQVMMRTHVRSKTLVEQDRH
jgi:hypothetical protein